MILARADQVSRRAAARGHPTGDRSARHAPGRRGRQLRLRPLPRPGPRGRVQPWNPYTRTLPAGPAPRFVGRVLAGLVLTYASMLPVVVIAAVATAAEITPLRFLIAIPMVAVVSVPFTLLGLAIGYSMPSKAAIVVAQLIFFPLAFGGGLLSGPDNAPGFIRAIAPYLPTWGAVELMWTATTNWRPDPLAMAMLAVWLVALAAVAAWAYRRDEGLRFS